MKPIFLFSALALSSLAHAQAQTPARAAPVQSDVPRVATRAQTLRRLMTAAGFTDPTIQKAVVDYVAAREKGRAELLQLARAAAKSLLKPDAPAIPKPGELLGDDAVTEAFGAYQNALEADNVDAGEGLEKLDKRVNFSGNPRLEAFLTLIGVLSDDVESLGGAEAVFETAPAK